MPEKISTTTTTSEESKKPLSKAEFNRRINRINDILDKRAAERADAAVDTTDPLDVEIDPVTGYEPNPEAIDPIDTIADEAYEGPTLSQAEIEDQAGLAEERAAFKTIDRRAAADKRHLFLESRFVPGEAVADNPLAPDQAKLMLSYSDVLEGKELRDAHDYMEVNESAGKYKDALIELSEKYGKDVIFLTAKAVKQTFDARAEALGLETSKYGKSISWAVWDIAKQYHMSKNPEETSDKYLVGDALDGSQKSRQILEDIINRQLGWEFNEKNTHDKSLHSYELSDLGRRLTELSLAQPTNGEAPVIEVDADTTTETPEAEAKKRT